MLCQSFYQKKIGLAKQHAILGMDLVCEQQLCIEDDHMFFQKFPLEESVPFSTLTEPNYFPVSPRTVFCTELCVPTARGSPIPAGTSGVASTAWDEVGVLDTLNMFDFCGRIASVVVNVPDKMQYFKKDDDLKKGLAGDSIAEVFGHFSCEPEDPTPGSSRDLLSEEDRKLMIDSVSIKASLNHHDLDLCLHYHDIFSKSKFDIGRTDVIEHKVHLKSEDPIHIRQFCIPLKHRQTMIGY